MEPLTVKAGLAAFGPLVKSLLDVFLAPKLDQALRRRKIDKALFKASAGETFSGYLERSINRYFHLSTITFHDSQRTLDELYVPLSLLPRSHAEGGDLVRVDSYPESLLPQHKRILLTDAAGMGKSTVLKYLFLECIRAEKGIPVFLELRKLQPDVPILEVIGRDISALDEPFDTDVLLALMKRGDFIFFLDGFDEIAPDSKEGVVALLQDWIAKSRENHFIVSSRPEGASAAFPDFAQFQIRPLEKHEAHQLIRKYGRNNELSNQLVVKLEEPQYAEIAEFLTNPLLVTLLFLSYQFKQKVPLKKPIFYRQVFDALFDAHDLTKDGAFVREKKSQLDIEEFHHVLRCLGFHCLRKGRVQYFRDDLVALIEESKRLCSGLKFGTGAFIDDLQRAVPLFVKDGEEIRWKHKSLMEYFAAQFICVDARHSQERILNAMYEGANCARYANVFNLCYDIEPATVRHSILKRALEERISYDNASYQQLDRRQISEDAISRRKRVHFGTTALMVGSSTLRGMARNFSLFEREGPGDRTFLKLLAAELEHFEASAVAIVVETGAERVHFVARRSSGRVLLEILSPRLEFEALKRKLESKEVRWLGDWSRRSRVSHQALRIDDSPGSSCNSPDGFEAVTSLLATGSRASISKAEAVALLEEIEIEILDGTCSDLMIADL